MKLFIERARAAKPVFAVTNETAPAVAEICHRLDGLPLAIELAAARIKVLPPQTPLAHLEQRLLLLTGGARDLPARQQTLSATIAWGYDLLSHDEKALIRHLVQMIYADKEGWMLEGRLPGMRAEGSFTGRAIEEQSLSPLCHLPAGSAPATGLPQARPVRACRRCHGGRRRRHGGQSPARRRG